jgi:flagellar hook-length control protein FliK
MTSANVSNIPIQITTQSPQTTKMDSPETDKGFMELMNQSMSRTTAEVSVTSQTVTTKAETPVKMDSRRDEVKMADKDVALDDKTVTEVTDKADEFSEKVEQVISEDLDVSEEEVEDVMESLGLTFMDLLVPANLAEVVGEIKGCEDTVELLLDTDFTDMLTQVKDLATAFTEETGFSLEELQNILSSEETPEVLSTDMTEMPEVTEPEVTAEAETFVTDQPEVVVSTEQITETAEEPEIVAAPSAQESAARPAETEEAQPKEEQTSGTVTGEATQTSTEKTAQQSTESGTNQQNSERQPARAEGNELSQMSGMVQTESVSYEATTQTITMETGEQVDVSRIIEQIVEQTKTVITDEITSMEMVLRPEGLGKLLMQVSQQEGSVTAHIYTQNEEVKEALENQMVMLKEQLNQGGTKVNSIEVSVATHEFERNLEEGQQERGQEEAPAQESKKARNINLNNLDELSGLMTEEEELVAKMMRDNGNTVNYRA